MTIMKNPYKKTPNSQLLHKILLLKKKKKKACYYGKDLLPQVCLCIYDISTHLGHDWALSTQKEKKKE